MEKKPKFNPLEVHGKAPALERERLPDTFLVQFIPHGHSTYRIGVLGRKVDAALEFANTLYQNKAFNISIIKMDGLKGTFEVQKLWQE